MAYGTELFIGWIGRKAIDEAIKSFPYASIDWQTNKDFDASDNLQQKFAELHEEAVQTVLGLKLLGWSDREYLVIETPDGSKREMSQWALEFHYDEIEMGDTEDTAVLGVSLISRYFPIFLDWKETHGGSGEPIVLDTKTRDLIAKTKDLLARDFPVFASADIVIKMLHY